MAKTSTSIPQAGQLAVNASDRQSVDTNNENEQILRQLEDLRARNNGFWVEIIRIAMEEAPERTKRVVSVINENDKAISVLLEKLAK